MPYRQYINLRIKSQHRVHTRNRKWFIAAVLLNFISLVAQDFEVGKFQKKTIMKNNRVILKGNF